MSLLLANCFVLGVDIDGDSPPHQKTGEGKAFDDVTGQVGKNVTAFVSMRLFLNSNFCCKIM